MGQAFSGCDPIKTNRGSPGGLPQFVAVTKMGTAPTVFVDSLYARPRDHLYN